MFKFVGIQPAIDGWVNDIMRKPCQDRFSVIIIPFGGYVGKIKSQNPNHTADPWFDNASA